MSTHKSHPGGPLALRRASTGLVSSANLNNQKTTAPTSSVTSSNTKNQGKTNSACPQRRPPSIAPASRRTRAQLMTMRPPSSLVLTKIQRGQSHNLKRQPSHLWRVLSMPASQVLPPSNKEMHQTRDQIHSLLKSTYEGHEYKPMLLPTLDQHDNDHEVTPSTVEHQPHHLGGGGAYTWEIKRHPCHNYRLSLLI